MAPRIETCDIRFGSAAWDLASIHDVLAHRERREPNFSTRCSECHGQVRALKAGAGAAHFEHMQRHPVVREVIVTMTLAAGLIPMRSADKTDRLV
jgi:hypothetical protein